MEGHPRGTPVPVRISLGDSDLEDALRVDIPRLASGLTVGDVLNSIFSEDEAEQEATIDSMDLAANPDLTEIYEELLDIVDQWRTGSCSLSLYANHGPRLELFHPVSDHLSIGTCDGGEDQAAVLDLVMEPKYEVLAHFAESGGEVEALLAWLRGLVLVYFIDKHGFRLSASPDDEADRGLTPIAEELAGRGLIAPAPQTLLYEITGEGRRLLGEVISETEEYIDRYGVFDDVLYDMDAGSVEFGTGRGEDLRPQVFWTEGVDPIRAVFLLRLYDSTLDEYAADWRELVQSAAFFDELLRPVLDHHSIDEEVLAWIIDAGLSHLEEAAEDASRQASQEATIDRVRGLGSR